MTLLGAAFTIEVDGILVDRDMLGEKLAFKADEDVWQILFPSRVDDFSLQRALAPDRDLDPREYEPVALVDHGGSMVEIRLVEVAVNFSYVGGLAVESYDSKRDYDEWDRVVKKYERQALAIVSDLCANLRLSFKQPWIEPNGRFPASVNALTLSDLDSGKAFPVLAMRGPTINIVERSAPLALADLPNLGATLAKGRLAPEQLLLSEAVYLAHDTPRLAPDRATLLAAIAVELHTKRTLSDLAGTERAAVADLLIVSMSAHGLFLDAVPLFAGLDPDANYTATARKVQKLFSTRNRIAHRGADIPADQAREHVQTPRRPSRAWKPSRPRIQILTARKTSDLGGGVQLARTGFP